MFSKSFADIEQSGSGTTELNIVLIFDEDIIKTVQNVPNKD